MTGNVGSAMVGWMISRVLPRSMRKFIRSEKARIRRAFSDKAEAEKMISELVLRVAPRTRGENNERR